MAYYTKDDVIAKLEHEVQKFDTDTAAARSLRMNNASLSRTLNGRTTVIPDKALKALGLVAVTVYTEKPKKGDKKKPAKKALAKKSAKKRAKPSKVGVRADTGELVTLTTPKKAMKKARTRTQKVVRDASSGEFVEASKAKTNPDTTVTETIVTNKPATVIDLSRN